MNGQASRSLALSTPKVLAEVQGATAWLTFNNPERRNAVSLAMWQAIAEAAEAFEADPQVRVVVMRGAGGKSFAAGADITEFEAHRADAAQKEAYGRIAGRAHRALAHMGKPLIALVEGYCVGGGLALALAADLRFCSTDARFAIPAARLGLGYEYEGVAALARLVGPSVAKDIFFSARFLEADEAWHVGLVNQVLPMPQLEQHVRDYAAAVAGNAPLTVQAAKAAVMLFERAATAGQDTTQVESMVRRCFDSSDYREGRRAFLDKRPPVFTGR